MNSILTFYVNYVILYLPKYKEAHVMKDRLSTLQNEILTFKTVGIEFPKIPSDSEMLQEFLKTWGPSIHECWVMYHEIRRLSKQYVEKTGVNAPIIEIYPAVFTDPEEAEKQLSLEVQKFQKAVANG